MTRFELTMLRVCSRLLTLLLLPHALLAAPSPGEIEMTRTTEGDLRVLVRPTERFVPGVVEMVDAGTGEVLRTLDAGRFRRTREIELPADAVPAGDFIVRYRERLALEFVDELAYPIDDGRGWMNPTDLLVTDAAVYVLESPLPMPGAVGDQFQSHTYRTADGREFNGRFDGVVDGRLRVAGEAVPLEELTLPDRRKAERQERERQWRAEHFPRIYRFTRDGRLDRDFGDGGRLNLPADRHYATRAFAVDDADRVYASDTYHSAHVFDAAGQQRVSQVGGWAGGDKTTAWVNSIAAGPGDRLYFVSNYVRPHLQVYDQTKAGFEGHRQRVELPAGHGLDRALAVDPPHIYVLTGRGGITRLTDDGEEVAVDYTADPPAPLIRPTAPFAHARLIWVSDRGPGPGPFWDSGGGGEVLLYFDTGEGIELVDRFGRPGTAADRAEFMHPSATWMSPDHRTLWVVEDGHPNAEGPDGNARIRRFRITAERETTSH